MKIEMLDGVVETGGGCVMATNEFGESREFLGREYARIFDNIEPCSDPEENRLNVWAAVCDLSRSEQTNSTPEFRDIQLHLDPSLSKTAKRKR